jgi:hypothetical protein
MSFLRWIPREISIGIRDVVGGSETHHRFYGRVLFVAIVVLVSDLAGSLLVTSDLSGFRRALLWSTQQVLTGGTTVETGTELSTLGHVVETVLQLVALLTVAGLAGSLGSFLLHLDRQRDDRKRELA